MHMNVCLWVAKHVLIPRVPEDLRGLVPPIPSLREPDLMLYIYFSRHVGESLPVRAGKRTIGPRIAD